MSGVGEHAELDALLLSVVYLLLTRGKLSLATAIYDNCLCAKTLCRTHSIHSNITTAYNNDLLTYIYGGVVVLGIPCTHKVNASEELVSREHTVEVLALDAHEAG